MDPARDRGLLDAPHPGRLWGPSYFVPNVEVTLYVADACNKIIRAWLPCIRSSSSYSLAFHLLIGGLRVMGVNEINLNLIRLDFHSAFNESFQRLTFENIPGGSVCGTIGEALVVRWTGQSLIHCLVTEWVNLSQVLEDVVIRCRRMLWVHSTSCENWQH